VRVRVFACLGRPIARASSETLNRREGKGRGWLLLLLLLLLLLFFAKHLSPRRGWIRPSRHLARHTPARMHGGGHRSRFNVCFLSFVSVQSLSWQMIVCHMRQLRKTQEKEKKKQQ
jgi:hypothetical protein